MTDETSPDPHQQNGDAVRLPQHDYVSRVRPDPAAPPQSALILEGLVGDSDRPGQKRLYFSRSLDYYAEFSPGDVVYTEAIPAEQPPLVGMEATRLAIRRDAPVQFTRLQTARPLDEYDLDVHLSATPLPTPDPQLFNDSATCPDGTRYYTILPTFLENLTDRCGTRFPTRAWRWPQR